MSVKYQLRSVTFSVTINSLEGLYKRHVCEVSATSCNMALQLIVWKVCINVMSVKYQLRVVTWRYN